MHAGYHVQNTKNSEESLQISVNFSVVPNIILHIVIGYN